MMYKFEYKRMPFNSVEEIKAVEKLVEQGWKVIQSGLFSVLLERKKK